MVLMDEVKKELEKNKNYDFSSETWTEEKLRILYDAIYTTEKIIKNEF